MILGSDHGISIIFSCLYHIYPLQKLFDDVFGPQKSLLRSETAVNLFLLDKKEDHTARPHMIK